jgi:hypothetical protein
VSWDQQFFDPILLPGFTPLVTMRDAARYIVSLPKAEQQAPEWQTAAEALMLIGEHGGDPMFAHIRSKRPVRLQGVRPKGSRCQAGLRLEKLKRANFASKDSTARPAPLIPRLDIRSRRASHCPKTAFRYEY